MSQRGTRRQSVHTERQRQLRKAEADTGPNDEEVKMGRPEKYDQTAPFILVAYIESKSQKSRKSGAAQRGKDKSYDVAVPGLTKQTAWLCPGCGVRCRTRWLCPGLRSRRRGCVRARGVAVQADEGRNSTQRYLQSPVMSVRIGVTKV